MSSDSTCPTRTVISCPWMQLTLFYPMDTIFSYIYPGIQTQSSCTPVSIPTLTQFDCIQPHQTTYTQLLVKNVLILWLSWHCSLRNDQSSIRYWFCSPPIISYAVLPNGTTMSIQSAPISPARLQCTGTRYTGWHAPMLSWSSSTPVSHVCFGFQPHDGTPTW